MDEISLKCEPTRLGNITVIIDSDTRISISSMSMMDDEQTKNLPYSRLYASGVEKMLYDERILKERVSETCYLSKMQFRNRTKKAIGKEILEHIIKILKKYIINGEISRSKMQELIDELELPFSQKKKKKEGKLKELKIKKKKAK